MESPKMIDLHVAVEHYGDAMRRGHAAGVDEEFRRLLDILKKHGHYDAVLILKKHQKKFATLAANKKAS
jgi:hypothetical protein